MIRCDSGTDSTVWMGEGVFYLGSIFVLSVKAYDMPCGSHRVFIMDRMQDEQYMRRAIELAKAGEGWVHPNPLVGAVIVKDGRLIGEGYHRRYGELHAERNAIADAKRRAGDSAAEALSGATIYVTLEPCCHHGKTPPCTEAIIENGIRRVVIGSRDPNPLVAGRGARILREAGIEVQEDFLRTECDALNPVFFHYIQTKRPYVIMKYAMTADGKIATKTGASRWITGEHARQEVHRLRHACMGIMAGIGTVLADDPLLNCRGGAPEQEEGAASGPCPPGSICEFGPRQPVRIICDSRLRIPPGSQICRTADEYETIVVCGEENDNAAGLRRLGIEVIEAPDGEGRIDLEHLMDVLGARGIDSILLEGGSTLNESALRAGIVSEVRAFIAPKLFGGRAKSPVEGVGIEVPDQAIQIELIETKMFGEDLMLRYLVRDEQTGGI